MLASTTFSWEGRECIGGRVEYCCLSKVRLRQQRVQRLGNDRADMSSKMRIQDSGHQNKVCHTFLTVAATVSTVGQAHAVAKRVRNIAHAVHSACNSKSRGSQPQLAVDLSYIQLGNVIQG